MNILIKYEYAHVSILEYKHVIIVRNDARILYAE